MKNFKLQSEKERFHTQRMQATEVTYKADDGTEFTHTIIKSRPSVCVIIFNDRNQIALIRQFRSTTAKWYIELPAGLYEDDESIEEAASRESQEETGIVIKNVRCLVKSQNILDPSKSNEDFGSAVAYVAAQTEQNLDEMEQIEKEIIWMDYEEVISRMRHQMTTGEDFYDGLQMSGHSTNTLLTYEFLSK